VYRVVVFAIVDPSKPYVEVSTKPGQLHTEQRRRTIEARRSRRDDTRRKILVGAIVLAKVEQGVLEESVLRGWLKGALTRPEDRALFGL
jgi:hypothetical protein